MEESMITSDRELSSLSKVLLTVLVKFTFNKCIQIEYNEMLVVFNSG